MGKAPALGSADFAALMSQPSDSTSLADALAIKQRHQRAGHGRDQFFIPAKHGESLAVANGYRPARLHDAPRIKKYSPFAGASRFVLNSTVRTAASAGINENAA